MLNRTQILQVVLIGVAIHIAGHLPSMWARKHLAQTTGSSGDVVATATELAFG